MDIWYIVYLALGRLFTFMAEKFTAKIEKRFACASYVNQVLDCVLCSGFWAYLILSFLTGRVIFEDWISVPVFSNVATGAVSAYIWYLLENGYKSTQPIVIE